MAAYEYEALDGQGRLKKGVISADSLRLARRELRKRQLFPTDVRQARSRATLPSLASILPARSTITRKERMLITRQLATLVGASVPIEEALRNVAEQAERLPVRQLVLALRSRVMEGQRLADSLAAWPADFPELYRAMVSAGEGSGALSRVLERLADYLDRTHKMRTKVQTALIYPAFLAMTAVGVVLAMMTFVVPRVVEQFEGMGRDLPGLTVALIGLSDFLRDYGLLMALILVLGGLALSLAMRRPGVRRSVHGGLLATPFLGQFIRKAQATRFVRTLGTLIASGVPALEALVAARKTVSNRIIAETLETATTQVREGASLSGALKRTGQLPPMVAYMASVGENTGQLEEMLDKAADYLEDDFESKTQSVVSLLEPMIIIVMGAVVATIVLAILLPILQLSSLTL